MKVVQTNKAYAPLVGGIETTVTNLAEGLHERGISSEVLVCNHVRSATTRHATINGVPVTIAPSWGFAASLPLSPSYFGLLTRMKGDILHFHEPFPLATLSFLASKKIARNFSRIVVSWYSDIVRQKWVLPVYGPMIHKFLKRADSILVSSPNLIASSEFLPAHADRCEVIPLGVKLGWASNQDSRLEIPGEIRRGYSGPLVLFVGRLVYYKGLQYLVDAFSLVPHAHLVIIGSGPLLNSLKARIAKLGLEKRISMLPPLPDEELHAFYAACDVFVLPSTEKSEAYGLVQIEAMACGKPVVSTNLDTGVTFLNQHGVTGFTVPPRDPTALSNAINSLLEDADLRSRLGRQAKERALREFSADMMVERTISVYERLLRG